MIDIKKVEEKDFVEIAEIYNFYIKNTVATFEEKTTTKKDLINKWQENQKMPFFGAYINNELVGYSYVMPYNSRSAYRFTVENSIYIHPDHTQKGIGNLLLEKLLIELKKQNFKEVIALIAISQGSEGSIKLHKKFEFQERGTIKNVGYKFDEFIDVAIMQKSL